MARIVVCGYMIRHPVAGNMLAYGHYLLGLERLGHSVTYLEESGWPRSCFDPELLRHTDDPSTGLRLTQAFNRRMGIEAHVVYVNRETGRTLGATREDLLQILRSTDLLINVGGVCWLPQFDQPRTRALVDMDPMFTQVGTFASEGFDSYDAYFSYGTNIGAEDCLIPTGSVEWLPTNPPVVTNVWTAEDRPPRRNSPTEVSFTTIANWSAYGGIDYENEHYGQKDEEFLTYISLPSRVSTRLEIALAGAPDETREKLSRAGWHLTEALAVSSDLDVYRNYVTGSLGEFSVAKNAYVKSRSGWFSDRSACYLAAGRPVVLQDTGYSRTIASGEGLLPFSSLDEASDALETVCTQYDRHSAAAREVAGAHFDHRRVLGNLLSKVGIGKP